MDLRRILFAVAGLLVVIGVIGLAVAEQASWGTGEMAALVVGSAALVVFATTYVMRDRKRSAVARVGEYAAVVIVAGVVVVLGVALVAGAAAVSLGAVLVVGVLGLVLFGLVRDVQRVLRARRREP